LKKLSYEYGSFKRPAFADSIVFPKDVTRLDSANVSDLHAKYAELFVFVNQAVAKYAFLANSAEADIAKAKQKIYADRPALVQIEKWRFDHIVNTDPAVAKLASLAMRYRAKRDYLSAIAANYEKYIAALSRELSRRQGGVKI
jgi:hypothetical protein